MMIAADQGNSSPTVRRDLQGDAGPNQEKTLEHRRYSFLARVQQAAAEGPRGGPVWSLVGWWFRHLRFLEIVLGRYEQANADFTAHSAVRFARMKEFARTQWRLTAEEAEDHEKAAELVHLEIETFYHFAKVLLDRVADVIYLAFNGKNPRRFGSSFTKLAKGDFTSICKARSMDGSALEPGLNNLWERVVRHKTRIVEHLFDPRLSPGLHVGLDGRTRIAMGLVAPKAEETEFDPHQTEDPSVLLTDIKHLIGVVLAFLETHFDRSLLASPSKQEMTPRPEGTSE